MKLYLDSADQEALEPLLRTGVFAGVTTNPTILRRTGIRATNLPELYRWAESHDVGQLFLQAWGADAATLTECGHWLRELGPRVVVKVPADEAGCRAARTLADADVPILLTAGYAPMQALLADAVGATYFAPYLGRMTDAGRNGRSIIATMQCLLDKAGSRTKILVASVRSVADIVALAELGVGAATVQPAVARELFTDELTTAAVATFATDAATLTE